jgi:phosphatidylinositol alpha 1,6-mannosyltransferase
MSRIRVALFACSYNEIDGVANTMRYFDAFAKSHDFPMLNVHAGFEQYDQRDGSVQRMELQRRWPKFQVDYQHDHDLNLWRCLRRVEDTVREFRPDIVHVTGPSDVGQMGALIAHRLRAPLAASWHTNLHEYAERRFVPLMQPFPHSGKKVLGRWIRNTSLMMIGRFYRLAHVLFAPNEELISMVEQLTGKRCYPMSRGIDTELFHPQRRKRNDGQFVVGYVGRLTKEKNVRFLRDLEQGLNARGGPGFRIIIVGQGREFPWLLKNLPQATLTGVLRGEQLAETYANFDAFVFPSHTDTFGNVVLEALAAGVPAVVTSDGGPKFIVEHERTGFVAKNDSEFIDYVDWLRKDPGLLAQMRVAAREHARRAPSWDAVFNSVYDVYERAAFRTANGQPDTASYKGSPKASHPGTNADAQLG